MKCTQRYVAYPRAFSVLARRLNATPAELAAWVWSGPKDGGLAAYLNANELEQPPRFYFDAVIHVDFNYIKPLMACWFVEEEITQFQPGDRYITGADLVERWSSQPGVDAEALIVARVKESRLNDIHPIAGGTQATSQKAFDPPIADALFVLADVEKIEVEEFRTLDMPDKGPDKSKTQPDAPTANWMTLVQIEATRRHKALSEAGAKPNAHSLRRDLEKWCRDTGVKGASGAYPAASYIYRHALRGWKPPRD